MSDRYKSLSKLPNQPAARLLAQANCKLQTQLVSPASATIETVLIELEGLKAYADMLMLLACCLPPRERVWWSCLAARDVIPDPAHLPPPLAASEAWVFNPTTDNRQAAADAWRRLAFPAYTRTPRDPNLGSRAVGKPEVARHFFAKPDGESHSFNMLPDLHHMKKIALANFCVITIPLW